MVRFRIAFPLSNRIFFAVVRFRLIFPLSNRIFFTVVRFRIAFSLSNRIFFAVVRFRMVFPSSNRIFPIIVWFHLSVLLFRPDSRQEIDRKDRRKSENSPGRTPNGQYKPRKTKNPQTPENARNTRKVKNRHQKGKIATKKAAAHNQVQQPFSFGCSYKNQTIFNMRLLFYMDFLSAISAIFASFRRVSP